MKTSRRVASLVIFSCFFLCSCFNKCGESNVIGFYKLHGSQSISIMLNEGGGADIELEQDSISISSTWEIDVDSGNIFLRFSQDDGEKFIEALKGSHVSDYMIFSGPFFYGLEIGCELSSIKLYVDRDSGIFFEKKMEKEI